MRSSTPRFWITSSRVGHTHSACARGAHGAGGGARPSPRQDGQQAAAARGAAGGRVVTAATAAWQAAAQPAVGGFSEQVAGCARSRAHCLERAHLRRRELRVHAAQHGQHEAGGLAAAVVRLGDEVAVRRHQDHGQRLRLQPGGQQKQGVAAGTCFFGGQARQHGSLSLHLSHSPLVAAHRSPSLRPCASPRHAAPNRHPAAQPTTPLPSTCTRLHFGGPLELHLRVQPLQQLRAEPQLLKRGRAGVEGVVGAAAARAAQAGWVGGWQAWAGGPSRKPAQNGRRDGERSSLRTAAAPCAAARPSPCKPRAKPRRSAARSAALMRASIAQQQRSRHGLDRPMVRLQEAAPLKAQVRLIRCFSSRAHLRTPGRTAVNSPARCAAPPLRHLWPLTPPSPARPPPAHHDLQPQSMQEACRAGRASCWRC